MIEGENHRAVADGNLACRELMDFWTNEVNKGDIMHLCIVATWSPSRWATGYGGALGAESASYMALDELKDILKDRLKNKRPPEADNDSTADRVIYNLSKLPVSFDFVGWLMNMEMTRVREGAPFPLKVGWFYGRDGNINGALNSVQRQNNFENILRPLLALVGAIEDDSSLLGGRTVESISLLPVVEACKQGETVPKFIPPENAVKFMQNAVDEICGKPPVTITLREQTSHMNRRNSNLTEWLKFAGWLEERGEKVIIVRDTVAADEKIAGFRTCPPASTDLVLRAALYSIAKANLFVSNGPALIAAFGDKPWLMFSAYDPDTKDWAHTQEGWKFCAGLEPYTQWPWSRPDQRIIWQPDTFENMKAAWLEHIEPQQAAAA